MNNLQPPIKPLVVAHRGASIEYYENTIEAFSAAKEQGADWVELDIRRSKDGVLVVHHDAHLADGRLIRDIDSKDLPAFIPSLAEAFECMEGLGVNIEVKSLPGEPDREDMVMVCEAVVGLALAYRTTELLRVSSFDMSAVNRIRAANEDLPTGWLVLERTGSNQILDRVVNHGHGAVHPWDELVDEAFINEAHQRDLKVFVWTVDDEERIEELALWQADAIITNRPGVAREIIDQQAG